MIRDAQGLSLSGSREASALYDRAVGHLVRFQAEVVEVAATAVTLDASCAMAGVLSAYLSLMSTEAAGADTARGVLAAVDAQGVMLTPREQAHQAAAARWVAGDMGGAGALLGEITIEYPRDLLALAVGHQIDFFTGNAARLRDRVGGARGSWTPDDANFGFVEGMYAFGLEECNLYELSEETAQQAVDTNPDDVWAIHAMTHTYEMQGEVGRGVGFLRDREGDWAAGNFLNVHNSWHYALFLLEGGDVSGALDVYDRVLHHDASEDVALELLDATSLLWRLHLEHVGAGDRWQPLADAWARILCPGFYPFNDMHAVMAFVGAGDMNRAHELVEALEEVAQSAVTTTGSMMTARVGLPVCRGLVAYGEGDNDRVLDELLRVREHLHEFGGSHAQRDVVQRTLLEAAIRGGRANLARALIDERLGVRDASTYAWTRRARLLADRGDPTGARAARERARDLADTIRVATTA